MKKLFVLTVATLVMGSVFAQGGEKGKKCTNDKECGKKKEGKDCCSKITKTATKATVTTVKPTVKKS